MKKILFKYKVNILSLLLVTIIFTNCTEEDVNPSDVGNPLKKTIVNVDATISSTQSTIGEGNIMPFDVQLSTSFTSNASLTVKVTLDNGDVSTGTAILSAGETSASGTVRLPGDDGFIPVGFYSENGGKLEAVAILLDELVPDTTHIINSNTINLNIWADTAESDGGLNYIFDWANYESIDIDIEIIDEAFTELFENSGTGDRFESDLFENAGRPDGNYVVYATIFSGTLPSDTPYKLLFTKQDNSLVALEGVLSQSSPANTRMPIAIFTKSTDTVTGEITYIDINLL